MLSVYRDRSNLKSNEVSSVMTRAFNRHFQPRSIAELQRKFNQPVFDAMERREPIDPATLPLLQQAALMQMHESHFSRRVYRALLEDTQDKPSLPDYRALVDMELAQKGPADKWHKLTCDGASAARNLEKHLCRKLDVHAFAGPLGTGHSVWFYCPCGWRVSVRNSPTAFGNAAVSWRRHHEFTAQAIA